MATRYLDKVTSLSHILNRPDAAGIGVLAGNVYYNNGGSAVPLNGPFTLRDALVVDATNYTATNGLYQTITTAVAAATTGDVIIVAPGDYDEHGISTPASVNFVTIVGTGNQPRACRWRNTANDAEPFITIRGNGWVLQNMYFAGGTADSCVELLRDATYNASESRILGCVFNGGTQHIEQNGGVANIIIANCRFIGGRGGSATTPGNIVGVSTAQAVPTNWEIVGNHFYNGDNIIACSMSRSLVRGNFIQAVGHDGAATSPLDLIFNSAQGDYNTVIDNYLGAVAANIDTGNGFKDGSNSVWANNFTSDGDTGDTPWYGVPTA